MHLNFQNMIFATLAIDVGFTNAAEKQNALNQF